MSALLTLTQAAPLLGCRDVRTARKRLAALGVPVVDLGRVLVDEGELRRAIRAHARPLSATADTLRPAGVALRPGERLWDSPAHTVAPRRANARGRGGRGVTRPRSEPTGAADSSRDRSASRSSRRTEEA